MSRARSGSAKKGGPTSSVPCQFTKTRATTLQGGFDRWDATPRNLANLLQRIAGHVSQDNGAPLGYPQTREGPEARSGDVPIAHRVYRSSDHIQILIGMSDLTARPSAEEIQRRVMSDPKQPRF